MALAERKIDLPGVVRNGVARGWDNPAEWALWRTVDREKPVVALGWKTGTLTVNAGGHTLESRYTLADREASTVRREDLETQRGLRAQAGFQAR